MLVLLLLLLLSVLSVCAPLAYALLLSILAAFLCFCLPTLMVQVCVCMFV